MLSDLLNGFMDSNEDATNDQFEKARSHASRMNEKKCDYAVRILSSMVSKQASEQLIQEQVELSLKYANVLVDTAAKIEKEQFTKARKRIK